MKDFKGDFDKLRDKLSIGENFAFARFSDGELHTLQNRPVELAEKFWSLDGVQHHGWYNKEEQKKFVPEEHQFNRQKLIDSLQFKKDNYYKGISCRCCVGEVDFKWQLDLHGTDETHESLTWANLWNNGNYEAFMDEIVPLFKDKEIIMVVNEIAKLHDLPFKVKKSFRVGSNCFINDYFLVDVLKDYIEKQGIENHVFLISCGSLSNVIIKQLYEANDNNTYIDIGSTLNPIMKMEGWKGSRAYLSEYWLKQGRNYLNKNCIW